MVVRSESRTEVAAGIQNVYEYLADVARWPEWARGILECRVSGGAALEPGSQLEQKTRKMIGGPGSRSLNVKAVEAPRRLEFAGTMGPAPLRWGFDLSSADAANTAVVLWVEAEPRGPMRALPAGLLRRMFKKVNQRELVAIATKVGAAAKS